jgi:hypothetical protein
MNRISILFIVALGLLLSGCATTKTEYIEIKYPQYKVVRVDPSLLEPVPAPPMPVTRDEFVAMDTREQRDVLHQHALNLTAMLKIANDHLLAVNTFLERAKTIITEHNKKLEAEVLKNAKEK